jgi:adenylosuccinate lyase
MIERYNTFELNNIWNIQSKIDLWKEISLKYALSFIDDSSIDYNELKNIKIEEFEIIEKEKTTKHEFLAFLEVLIEKSPDYLKKYIHYGLTSSDILDTTFSYQLKNSAIEILNSLNLLLTTIFNKAIDNKNTIMMGRTHGMYAEPISFGLVLFRFYYELKRSKSRLQNCINTLSYGQLSGPIGNYTICDIEKEVKVLKSFNLNRESLSTQVIPRDRYAELFCTLGILASTIENIATEIRQLSQSSICEVSEGFSKNQKGSSSMPHKKNPINSENLCGLARLIRSYINPSLENITLWYERDMSHSSNERFIGQDSTTLTHFILKRLNNIIENLVINEENMNKNIQDSFGLFFSQRLLISLIDKNIDRLNAYEIVQKLTFEAFNKKQQFVNILLNDYNINSIFTQQEIKDICNFNFFINKNKELWKVLLENE